MAKISIKSEVMHKIVSGVQPHGGSHQFTLFPQCITPAVRMWFLLKILKFKFVEYEFYSDHYDQRT